MRLRYTAAAADELETVLDGIAVTSPRGARRVKAGIRAAIARLLDHPRSGRATSLRPLRRIVARPYPYLIYYIATETEVTVIAVRHAARDPATMPDFRE